MRRFQLLFADMPGRSTVNQRRYAGGSFLCFHQSPCSVSACHALHKSRLKTISDLVLLHPSQWYVSSDEALKVISHYNKQEKSQERSLEGESELFCRKNTVVLRLGLSS